VSGLALAVSLFKPTFGVPLALLMLVRGDSRAVLAGVGFAAILNGPPLLVLVHRAGSWTGFTDDLVRSQQAWQGVVDPATQVYGVDAPGLVSRLLGSRLPAVGYLAVAFAVLGAAAAALRALARAADRQVSHLSAAIICLGILLSVHHHAYDLVLLVAPVVALTRSSLPATFLRPWRRRTLLILFLILGANYITTLSILRHLERYHAAWLVLASLNGGVLLAIFMVYAAYRLPARVPMGTVTSPSLSEA
jgi:hypothetical protein